MEKIYNYELFKDWESVYEFQVSDWSLSMDWKEYNIHDLLTLDFLILFYDYINFSSFYWRIDIDNWEEIESNIKRFLLFAIDWEEEVKKLTDEILSLNKEKREDYKLEIREINTVEDLFSK